MKGKFPGRDSELQIAVMTDQKAENHSGDHGAYLPMRYGEDCNTEDCSLSSLLNSPTGFMQQIFPGAMDPGTSGVMMREAGSLGGVIIGQFNSIKKGAQDGGSGGGGLGSLETIAKLSSTSRNINIAPDIKEVDGVRQIIEKGQQHNLDLLDGLPIHGALFDMAGFRLPEIKKVNTAKQKNTGMMSMDQLQQMMGQIMSLGQMIQGLAGNKGGGGGAGGFGAGGASAGSGGNSVSYMPPGANTGAGGMEYGGGLGNNIISAAQAPEGTLLYQIMDGLTPNMKAAVNSLSILLQGYEVQDGVSFFTGDVVHEDTYLQNAYDLLKDVSNLDDLMYVLNRLQWDESLRGTEKLENVKSEIQTAWGVALQEIDVNGNIVITYGAEDANLEMEFANSMTSNTSSPALGFLDPNLDLTYSVNATNYTFDNNNTGGGSGAGAPNNNQGGGGSNAGQVLGQVKGLLGQVEGLAQSMSQNMFGESAETMKDMWKRMTREQENDAKQMHKKLNNESDTQKMSKIAEKIVKGGDVFEMGLFDENNLESTGGDSVGSGNFSVGFM